MGDITNPANRTFLDIMNTPGDDTIAFDILSTAFIGSEKVNYCWASAHNNGYGSLYYNGYLIFEQYSPNPSLYFKKKDVNCFGGADGNINLTVRDGKKPYSYEWSNDSTTEDITGLSPGIYSVNVSDANDSTATDSIYISEPELLIAEITDSSNTSYYGFSDGIASVKVTGGTLPYFYQWDDSAMTSGPIV